MIDQLPFARGWAVQNYLGVEESLAFAQNAGATHFYIDAAYGADAVDAWDDARIERILELNSTRLTPILHGNFKVPLAHEAESLRLQCVDYAKREIDLASRLGASIIVHGSCIMAHRNPKESVKQAVLDFADSVNRLCAYAADRGVPIWLENLERYTEHHPFYTIYSQREHYEQVLERAPGALFMLDIGHDFVGGGDPAATLTQFASRVVGINLHDNNGSADAHMMIGDGRLDFRAVLGSIEHTGWSGLVVFEIRNQRYQEAAARLRMLAEAPAVSPL